MAGLPIPPDKQKQVLTALLIVVGGLFWLQFFAAAQMKRWSRLRAETARLQRQVTEMKRHAVRLQEMERQRDRLIEAGRRFGGTAGAPQERLPAFLEEIARIARAAGVEILTLRPAGKLETDPGGAAGPLEVPLELSAEAGYHQMGRFLDALERSELLIRIGRFSFQEKGRDIWNHRLVLQMEAHLPPAS